MRTLWQVVWEIVERGPDRREHDLETLPALEGLRAKPDTGNYTANKDSKVRPAYAKGSAGENGEVDPEDTAKIAVQHGGHADENMANEDGQDCEAWVEAFGYGR